eukprot:9053380-Pyramimonas_sp.AAC.1
MSARGIPLPASPVRKATEQGGEGGGAKEKDWWMPRGPHHVHLHVNMSAQILALLFERCLGHVLPELANSSF